MRSSFCAECKRLDINYRETLAMHDQVLAELDAVFQECDRLWLEYVEALSEALKISEQWELARIQQDSNLCDMLELQWVQTFGRRLAARKTFKDHETTHGQ